MKLFAPRVLTAPGPGDPTPQEKAGRDEHDAGAEGDPENVGDSAADDGQARRLAGWRRQRRPRH
jgi:hypothetical protein